eukprot:scaffold11285_cov20-Tisochrysis_lutea.AAC.1
MPGKLLLVAGWPPQCSSLGCWALEARMAASYGMLWQTVCLKQLCLDNCCVTGQDGRLMRRSVDGWGAPVLRTAHHHPDGSSTGKLSELVWAVAICSRDHGLNNELPLHGHERACHKFSQPHKLLLSTPMIQHPTCYALSCYHKLLASHTL